jgi:hypothetical protein
MIEVGRCDRFDILSAGVVVWQTVSYLDEVQTAAD